MKVSTREAVGGSGLLTFGTAEILLQVLDWYSRWEVVLDIKAKLPFLFANPIFWSVPVLAAGFFLLWQSTRRPATGPLLYDYQDREIQKPISGAVKYGIWGVLMGVLLVVGLIGGWKVFTHASSTQAAPAPVPPAARPLTEVKQSPCTLPKEKELWSQRRQSHPNEPHQKTLCWMDAQFRKIGWNCVSSMEEIPSGKVGAHVGKQASGTVFDNNQFLGYETGADVEGRNSSFHRNVFSTDAHWVSCTPQYAKQIEEEEKYSPPPSRPQP